jgi:hypothetical protein
MSKALSFRTDSAHYGETFTGKKTHFSNSCVRGLFVQGFIVGSFEMAGNDGSSGSDKGRYVSRLANPALRDNAA